MKWLADLLSAGITAFHAWTGNYGLAIILLTVFVRVVLLPLTWSGARSMAHMQALGPEIEELRKRYKNDPQKLNQAQVELWRQHKVNPLSGCLSVIVEFPIVIALFQVLRDYQYTGAAGFLWVPNLSLPDPLHILPVLAAAATYWQARISTPPSTGGNETMTLVSLAMGPAMMLYFTWKYSAGLGLYWTVSTILRAMQQYLIPRAQPSGGGTADAERREERPDGGGSGKRRSKGSGGRS